MRRRWRWVVVAVGVVALVAIPFVVQAVPSGTSTVSAATLLSRIRASSDVAYSAYAQSTGGLALPAETGPFDFSDLFGGTSQLRIWQRDSAHWRVDSIDATGERDLHHEGNATVTWNYESNQAQVAAPNPASVRLPRADDLAPADLARRLVSETAGARVSRIADARIAGQDAAGIRLRVDDSRSTITRIDVWALPGNGLPLRVAVYGADRNAFLSSTTYDLTLGKPAASTVDWRPADGVRTVGNSFPDILSVVDQFGRSRPPATVAGLPRRAGQQLGAVGVYGSGVEVLVAVPLSARLARAIVPQLSKTPGAVVAAGSVAVGSGPLNVQVGAPTGDGARWLLVGTLQAAALRTAMASLPPAQGFGFFRRHR